MAIRRCPQCAHRAPLLAGRCTEPDGQAICGCVCSTTQRAGRTPRKGREPELIRLLQAVEQGRTSGWGISFAASVPMAALYPLLRQCVADGFLERDAGRGPHRNQYRLTPRGSLLLAAADAA